MKKSKLLLSFAIALCSVGVLSSGGMEVKKVRAEETASSTYQFVFTAKPKPSEGTISLDGVSWTISTTNLNDYNSSNYAGVQFGTKKSAGRITLTSSSDWNYNGNTYIDSVELYLNQGGGTVTPSVKIGGEATTKEGTVTKNSNAGSDWTKTSKITFTPVATNTGIVEIDVASTVAGYICAMIIKASNSPKELEPSVLLSTIDDTTYTKVNGDSIQFTSELKNVETAPTPVYTSSDDTIASFDGANLVPHKMGKVTATVTYKVGETDYTATKEIVIYPDNTNPLTVAEALTVCEYTGSNNAPYDYAVRGIISGAKYNSDYKNTDAYLNDLDGEASIKIFRAAATSANDIVDGKYYEFRGTLVTYSDGTKEITNCSSSDYNVLPLPLDYAYSNVSALSQLSFAFEKEAEGTFGGFTNMSLNFKTAFDFTEYTKGTDFTEAGMMFIIDSDVSETYSKTTAEALPEGAKKATQTDYSKAFIVRLEDIPVSDWEKDVTVVPYILIDGTYYFGTASATNVIKVAGAYSSSEATITLSDESVVKVKDVAAAIENFYIASI